MGISLVELSIKFTKERIDMLGIGLASISWIGYFLGCVNKDRDLKFQFKTCYFTGITLTILEIGGLI